MGRLITWLLAYCCIILSLIIRGELRASGSFTEESYLTGCHWSYRHVQGASPRRMHHSNTAQSALYGIESSLYTRRFARCCQLNHTHSNTRGSRCSHDSQSFMSRGTKTLCHIHTFHTSTLAHVGEQRNVCVYCPVVCFRVVRVSVPFCSRTHSLFMTPSCSSCLCVSLPVSFMPVCLHPAPNTLSLPHLSPAAACSHFDAGWLWLVHRQRTRAWFAACQLLKPRQLFLGDRRPSTSDWILVVVLLQHKTKIKQIIFASCSLSPLLRTSYCSCDTNDGSGRKSGDVVVSDKVHVRMGLGWKDVSEMRDFDTVQFVSHVKAIVNVVPFIRDPATASTTCLLLWPWRTKCLF